MKKDGIQHNYDIISDYVVLLGLSLIMLLLLIPIFVIAKYSFIQGDDILYYFQAGDIWRDGHSFLKTIIYEGKQSIELWKSWQGLFFSDWVYLVIMAFWGEKAFGITAFIGIISLILSSLFFLWVVFYCIAGENIKKSFAIGALILVFQISIPSTAAEAFFWMVGMTLYTFSFSMSLVFVSVVLLLLSGKSKNNIVLIVLCIILSFAVGGSTYVLSLPIFVFLAILTVLAFVEKKENKALAILVLLCYLLFFAINVFSPGARIRMSGEGNGYSPLLAIVLSFSEALVFLLGRLDIPFVLLNVFLIPLYILMHKEAKGKKRIAFKHPEILSLISYCVFASMFTPNLYALGMIGVYRVQNLYRFVCFLLVPVNIWYWTGFVLRVIDNRKDGKKTNDRAIKSINKKIVFFSILKIFYAAFASAIILFSLYKTYGRTMTSVSAYYSLRSGEAETFYNEWQERLAVLEDETITDPVFEPFSQKPYLLYMADLSEDSNHYVNRSLAEYYNKNSVRLKGE